MDIWVPILVAVITGIFGIIGSALVTSKQEGIFEAIVTERIAKLTEKVEKHNNLIERTYQLEAMGLRQEDELKRLNERLRIVEGKKNE